MKVLDTELKKMNSKSKDRLGRGIAAGGGKTAGRGTKGQKSRAGHNIPKQFEGGQSNLSLRLPKIKGFKGAVKPIVEISLGSIQTAYKSGDTINAGSLIAKGLLKAGQVAKILANGEISIKVTVAEGINISKSAAAKIAAVKEVASKESKEESVAATPAKKTTAKKTSSKKTDK